MCDGGRCQIVDKDKLTALLNELPLYFILTLIGSEIVENSRITSQVRKHGGKILRFLSIKKSNLRRRTDNAVERKSATTTDEVFNELLDNIFLIRFVLNSKRH